MKPTRIKKERPALPELKKGSMLMIKTPPYYSKEYPYEITSAGDKLIRASLYHSPTVRKSWTKEELQVHFEHGIVRLATESEVTQINAAAKENPSEPQPEETEP